MAMITVYKSDQSKR